VILVPGHVLSPQHGPTPVYTDAGLSSSLGGSMALWYLWTHHGNGPGVPFDYPFCYTYAADVADEDASADAVFDLMTWERAIHHRNTIIAYGRSGLPGEHAWDRGAVTFSRPGLRGLTTDGPSYVTWATLVTWYSGGRWCGRKLLRLGLHDDDQDEGVLAPSLVSLVESAYVAPIVAAGVYCSRSGALIDGGRVDSRLHYHRLRSGTNRRAFIRI
jgi:hypothetical protein